MPQASAAYSLVAVFSATSAANGTRRALTEHGCRVDERTAVDGYSRQWTVSCAGETALKYAEALLHQGLGLSLRSCRDRVTELHRDGKLRAKPTQRIRSVTDLTMAYTPGAVRIARLLHDEPARAAELTTKGNTVAVISDGTAVPGYGNLGALPVLPVLEGKAMIYTSLSDLNAVPLVLDTKSVERFVETVGAIAGGFAAIHLECIAAPRCFVIEETLRDQLEIPVLHDEQHATAIAVLAGLRNALRLVGKRLEDARIVVAGAGAAGTATTRLLLAAGATDVIVVDRRGILQGDDRDDAAFHHVGLAKTTNPRELRGSLEDALPGADVFIGLSRPGILKTDWVGLMASDPIVFALANPEPEVDPVDIQTIAAVVATGSGEHPNQLTNALVFPGLMRGLIDAGGHQLNEEISLAAADALARSVGAGLSPRRILPDLFDPRVHQDIASAVIGASNARVPEHAA